MPTEMGAPAGEGQIHLWGSRICALAKGKRSTHLCIPVSAHLHHDFARSCTLDV